MRLLILAFYNIRMCQRYGRASFIAQKNQSMCGAGFRIDCLANLRVARPSKMPSHVVHSLRLLSRSAFIGRFFLATSNQVWPSFCLHDYGNQLMGKHESQQQQQHACNFVLLLCSIEKCIKVIWTCLCQFIGILELNSSCIDSTPKVKFYWARFAAIRF